MRRLLSALIVTLIPAAALACGGPVGSSFSYYAPTYGQSSVRHGRSWGPEQVTGTPDTMMAGDMVTAWASQTPDEHNEWLQLTYRKAVNPTKISIYETFNPGAVVKVTVFKGNKEVTVWDDEDPVIVDGTTGIGIAEIPVDIDFATRKVKIYLDSKEIMGWNEIDAVSMTDAKGKDFWAVSAKASSTFAAPMQ